MDTLLGTPLYAAAPNTRSYRAGGLPGSAAGSEPSGDAGEGTDLPVYLLAALGRGRDYGLDAGEPRPAPLINDLRVNHESGFTPVPGMLPGEKHLNYARAFTTTTLLTIAVVYLVYKAVTSPGSTGKFIAHAAGRQAGVG